MPAWQVGGKIRATWALARSLPVDPAQRDVAIELDAIDSCGRRLEFPNAKTLAFEGLASEVCELDGLWPETWTARLQCNGRTIAQTEVPICGTETIECGLVAREEATHAK